MIPVWQGFFLILGVGIVVLLIAALADRRTRLRTEGPPLEAEPDTTPDTESPTSAPSYLTATELLRHSQAVPVDSSTNALLRGAPTVALTLASPDLNTHDERSLATDARVLVCDDEVLTFRELLPVWGAVSPGQALTVAAPAFDPAVIDDMTANSRGGIRVVQALVGDADARATLADLTLATPVDRADRQAGAVPVTALGHARVISADAKTTTIVV